MHLSSPLPAIQTGIMVNDLNTVNRAWYSYNTKPYSSIVVQVTSVDASWVSGVTVDVEISLDGKSWSAFSTAQTYSSNGVKSKLDIQDINQVRCRVSASSSDGTIRVIVFGDTDA